MAEKLTCPACGEAAGVPIVYGMVPPEDFDDPDVVMGGCVIDGFMPNRVCRACDFQWRDDEQSEPLRQG